MNNIISRKKLITDVLIKLGADTANNGFYILRDAVLVYMEYKLPSGIRQCEVFTAVAKKYGISWTSAYTEARFLMENIMLHGDVEFLEKYFGTYYKPEKGTIMPKAFIARIADDVKIQCEELSKKGDTDIPDERKQVIEEIVEEIEGISNIAMIRFILSVVRSYKKSILSNT
ncbi:MAG: sporulation initiation factor Spo0A C-terminal domain-containing protein [Lachnospiraceae bacterium]|nr:sporulation initiation factor Spo0A C-terminal domain-containing protein [Lachnospiraceae bacterium]